MLFLSLLIQDCLNLCMYNQPGVIVHFIWKCKIICRIFLLNSYCILKDMHALTVARDAIIWRNLFFVWNLTLAGHLIFMMMMCVYMHTYLYMWVYICIYVYTHTCICVNICVHVYIYTHATTHALKLDDNFLESLFCRQIPGHSESNNHTETKLIITLFNLLAQVSYYLALIS